MYKRLISCGLIAALALGAVGCKEETNLESKVQNSPQVTKIINGQEYKFEGHIVTQLTKDQDHKAVYGVISDIHGEVEKAKAFAQKFKEMGVDGIILPGDLPNNEELRYHRRSKTPDVKEITQVLEVIAQTGLPIFVIPGNHEKKQDYESALTQVTARYNNIIDMTKFRVFDGDDVDFVSLPGYQTKFAAGDQFIPNDGYWTKPDFIKATGKLAQGLDDSIVLIAHGAGYTNTNGKPGPATTDRGTDVGDRNTTQMMKDNNINFAVVGNIHEAGGFAATHDGVQIRQGTWAKQFSANFGGLEKWRNLNGTTYNGMAGTITVKGDNAKFEMLYIK